MRRSRGGGSAQEGCCVSVGKILGLRKDSAGELYMLCRWYSRPEQAASGRRPYDGCNELLADGNTAEYRQCLAEALRAHVGGCPASTPVIACTATAPVPE